MLIRTKIDVLPLVQATLRGQKNLVYSTVQGINDTARKIQDAQRGRLDREFRIRTGASRSFMERNIAVIKPFASVGKGRIYAEIAIGQKRRLLLSQFEPGAWRKPFKGKNIAVPVVGGPARPNFASTINAQFTFQAMALKATKVSTARRRSDKRAGRAMGSKQFKGQNGTFIIQGTGVFVRSGRGRREIDLVYGFRARQKLDPKLHWMQTAHSVADRWLSERITQRFLRSTRSATP